MSFSTYLDNMMRQGRATHNAKLAFAAPGSSVIQCLPYSGTEFTTQNPLLTRYQGGSTGVLTTGILALDINVSFGLRDNEGYEWLYVGLQKITDITPQLCVGLLADASDSITTLASPTVLTRNQVLAGSSQTGPITWFAKLALMKRVGGVWDSSEAQILYYE